MNTLTLTEAAQQIYQACEDNEDSGLFPFFFVVGAGISHPSIPLAPEIEKECKAKATVRGVKEPSGNPSPLDRYSHWFEKAYQHPIHRQKYLRKLMERKPISQANLRLAHLLSEKKVASLVVTPNFDDLLSRALHLFGIPHILCDHPQTVERIDPESDDLQIVHVHGTYWFYDCCNLRDEIANQAKPSAETTLTMPSKLDSILTRRSPLILGYSGWEGDVIMTALYRRLQNRRLPYRLYWFCYRQGDPEALPNWIKDHSDCYFVIPRPQTPEQPERKMQGTLGRPDEPSTGFDLGIQAFREKDPEKEVLSAEQVLHALNEALHLGSPQILHDPLGYLAAHLQRSLPEKELSSEAAVDTERGGYFFHSVVQRISLAKEKLEQAEQEIDKQLENIQDAIRRSQYQEAFREAGLLKLSDLNAGILREVFGALNSSLDPVSENLEEQVRRYNVVIDIGNILSQKNPAAFSGISLRFALTLHEKGYYLGTRGHPSRALDVFAEIIHRFGDSAEPRLQEQVASALLDKAFASGELEQRDHAIAAYDEVLRRFRDASEAALQESVAWALVYKGIILGQLGQWDQAIAVYDEVLRRFGDASEAALQKSVAWALVNKGAVLRELGQRDQDMAVCDEVLRRFGNASEAALQESVARALVTKSATLGLLGQRDQAIGVCDEVLRRFGDASEPALQEMVARALSNKSLALAQLRKPDQAIVTYEEVIQRFGENTQPTISEVVVKAKQYLAEQRRPSKRVEKTLTKQGRSSKAKKSKTKSST